MSKETGPRSGNIQCDSVLLELVKLIKKDGLKAHMKSPMMPSPISHIGIHYIHVVDGIVAFDGRIIVPSSLRCDFLEKIHEPHLGIVKSKMLAKTLIYWPGYNYDIETMCLECEECTQNQTMPKNVPQFHIQVDNPGEIYGCDVTDIKCNQHLVIVEYKSVCIFERKLPNLTSTSIIDALKSMFCDVSAPDRLIIDNARYFVSDEFTEFMTKWSIVHVMLSPQYPQRNSHIEKAVQTVKNIYEKCHDVKMGLLLLKTTPMVSGHDQRAPCNVFFQCQLKANLPIFRSAKKTSVSDHENMPVMMSKFKNHKLVWCKVDPNPSRKQEKS